MTKHQIRNMENARQFMAELVNEFISNPALEMLSIDTDAGSLVLSKCDNKWENARKIGFDTGEKNEQ